MSQITVDFSTVTGKIKPMHAVNNGPVVAGAEQIRSNFNEFKAAKIPFVRNHDASFWAGYGGEHTVDVHAIFPNFDADPEDPESYDFFYTDQYSRQIMDAGSQVYYRLGTKIEHGKKKYGSLVPKDFKKWAVICEHIIRHYNEGWADGHHWDIRYWEIWNEPDGIGADGGQPNWSGTPEEFYELYKIASRHLKARFPELMIGGPAVSWFNEPWIRNFLRYQRADGNPSPIDFFGWHWYGTEPRHIGQRAQAYRKVLDEEGYPNTETYLNEWNYVEGWGDPYVASIQHVIGIRGAAMTAAGMLVGQASPVDMLMYYDARPCPLNGMFDFYTFRPLKGYYPFPMFSQLYQLGNEVKSGTDEDDLYVAAATDGERHAAMMAYYSPDKNAGIRKVKIHISGHNGRKLRCYLLDEANTMTELPFPESGEIKLMHHSVLLVTDYSIAD